jgi:hypothetical protein
MNGMKNPNEKFCQECGARINIKAEICPQCGVRQPGMGPFGSFGHGNPDGDRWLITLLLCVFLGAFGVHRFYNGLTLTGILMLITLGGCGIWVIIDIIMIAMGSFTDAEGKFVKPM